MSIGTNVQSPAATDGGAPSGGRGWRAAVAGLAAAALGAAPHVLHHAGPLAGAALLGGVGGTLLFAVLGLLASIPMLRRLHRRTGSWRIPGAVLAAMTGVFLASSLLIGPTVSSSGDDASNAPRAPGVSAPTPAGHEAHHQK